MIIWGDFLQNLPNQIACLAVKGGVGGAKDLAGRTQRVEISMRPPALSRLYAMVKGDGHFHLGVHVFPRFFMLLLILVILVLCRIRIFGTTPAKSIRQSICKALQQSEKAHSASTC